MRLEDAQADSLKGIWAVERAGRMCLVPALTAVGARARMELLDLAGPGDDLTFTGPVDRRAWAGLPLDEWFGEDVFDAWHKAIDQPVS
jgi:hypothetical protein